LSVSTNGVLRLFGIDPNEKEEAVSEEDIVTMLDAGADEGGLDEDDVEYIKNVFKLDNLTAADVMTQRSSVVAIPEDISKTALLKIIKEEGYSRIPVYADSLDKIIGVLYAREYLLNYSNPKYKIEDAMFPPKYVPETMHLDALLKEMQDSHNHIAIVVNEYGLTSGVVSMEDIIEELVGEIWDELDEAIEPIKSVGDDVYRVLTTVSLDEFFTFFELDPDEESDSTTVNGWAMEVLERIPAVGDEFEADGLHARVLKMNGRRIENIHIIKLAPEEEDEDTKERSKERSKDSDEEAAEV
jgi:putative hemolysin